MLSLKLKEISRIIKETNFDTCVFLGDIIDANISDFKLLDLFTETVNKSTDKDIHIVNGNHDRLPNRRYRDILKYISKGNITVFTEPVTVKDALYLPHSYDYKDFLNKYKDHHDVMFGHFYNSNLINEGFIKDQWDMSHIADYIFCGHYHVPSNNNKEYNIGCLFKTKINETFQKQYATYEDGNVVLYNTQYDVNIIDIDVNKYISIKEHDDCNFYNVIYDNIKQCDDIDMKYVLSTQKVKSKKITFDSGENTNNDVDVEKICKKHGLDFSKYREIENELNK